MPVARRFCPPRASQLEREEANHVCEQVELQAFDGGRLESDGVTRDATLRDMPAAITREPDLNSWRRSRVPRKPLSCRAEKNCAWVSHAALITTAFRKANAAIVTIPSGSNVAGLSWRMKPSQTRLV